MASPLMALHVAAHREGLSTSRMCAAERLLTSVAVRVNTQAGGPRESLVAGPADVPVVVLLVGRGVGGREVVVVLPSRVDGRDHLLRSCCHGGGSGSHRGSWSGVVVDCGGGSSGGSRSRSSGLNGRRSVRHAGGGRSVGAGLDGALAGDRGTVRWESDGVLESLVVDGRGRGRVAGPVEGRAGAHWRSRRQADGNSSRDGFVGPRLRAGVRRSHSLALCGLLVTAILVFFGGGIHILAGCMAALSAPSKRVEMEGKVHLGWSSTGGERGG